MDSAVEILKILKNVVSVIGNHRNTPLNRTSYITVVGTLKTAAENIQRLNPSTTHIQEYLLEIQRHILNNTFSSYTELKVQIQRYLPERIKMDLDITQDTVRESLVDFANVLVKL